MPRLKATLTFDGGSRGNPGAAYGSYLIESRGSSTPLHRLARLEFGCGTNNEAEYLALLAGLRDVQASLAGVAIPTEDVELTIRGDSQLILRQVGGEWKVKDPRMRRLCYEAQRLLQPFGRVLLRHQPRSRTVRQLGH